MRSKWGRYGLKGVEVIRPRIWEKRSFARCGVFDAGYRDKRDLPGQLIGHDRSETVVLRAYLDVGSMLGNLFGWHCLDGLKG